MIKVIATDLDGTLLGDDHRLAREEYEAILKALDAGIRIIITTGRDYAGALAALKGFPMQCDYVVASGAEIRDPQGNILQSIHMDKSIFPVIFDIIQRNYRDKAFLRFCANGKDYFLGTAETVHRQIVLETRLFLGQETGMSDEELANLWKTLITSQTIILDSVNDLLKLDDPIYKIFISSGDPAVIAALTREMKVFETVAAASSFPGNLELTDNRAQKGPVLSAYIQSLGYRMEEVMVLGDSMNDYSMLSMDFGATVAMGNAMDEVKCVAKYIAKSNTEHGAAECIHAVIRNQCLPYAERG